jgi:hypothetical protein
MKAVFIDSGMPALRALARLGAIKKKKPVPVGRPGRLRVSWRIAGVPYLWHWGYSESGSSGKAGGGPRNKVDAPVGGY